MFLSICVQLHARECSFILMNLYTHIHGIQYNLTRATEIFLLKYDPGVLTREAQQAGFGSNTVCVSTFSRIELLANYQNFDTIYTGRVRSEQLYSAGIIPSDHKSLHFQIKFFATNKPG